MADYYGSLGTNYTLRLTVNLSSQNIAANQSTVAWSLTAIKNTGSGYSNFSSTPWSASIAGSGYSGSVSSYSFVGVGSILIASGSTTFNHAADGTASVSVSGDWDPDNAPALAYGSAGGTFVPPTIPRASVPTLSASSFDANTAVTITTNRASSGFTHTISYNFGALTNQTSGLAASTGVGASTTFTPPLSLLNQIPNAVSGSGTIKVTTFNGATQIGTPQTVGFTLTAPSSVIPTISSLSVSEGTVSPDVDTLIGGYVQNVSKLALAISGAAGAYGSTIVSYKMTVAGQTINSSSGTTLNPISLSGTVPVTAEVTDSRGRKSSFANTNVTILPYTAPTPVTVEARRALVDGTVDQTDGTYIRVDMEAVVQSLIVGSQKNELQYRVSTSPHGADTWTVRVGPTTSGASTLAFDSYSGSFPYILVTSGAPYSVSQSFDVKVEVIDVLAVTPTTRTVATGAVLVDFDGSDGIGILKYHEDGVLDVGGDIYQNGYNVVDLSLVASATDAGIVELATNAETQTGTDTTRAVTPASLRATTATTTRIGVVELATVAEARTGTDTARAITPEGAAAVHALGQIPSSVVVGSGSASVADDGTVSFSGVSSISFNGVFDGAGGDTYELVAKYTVTGVNGPGLRLRSGGGTDSAGTNYDTQRGRHFGGSTDAAQTLSSDSAFMTLTTMAATGYLVLVRALIAGPNIAAATLILTQGFVTPNSLSTATGVGSFFNNWLHKPTTAYPAITLVCGSSTTITGTAKIKKVS